MVNLSSGCYPQAGGGVSYGDGSIVTQKQNGSQTLQYTSHLRKGKKKTIHVRNLVLHQEMKSTGKEQIKIKKEDSFFYS